MKIVVDSDGTWVCTGCSRTFPKASRPPRRGGCKECRGHRVSIPRLGETFLARCSCGWMGRRWRSYGQAKREREVHEHYVLFELCSCGRPELYAPHDRPCLLPTLGSAPQQSFL